MFEMPCMEMSDTGWISMEVRDGSIWRQQWSHGTLKEFKAVRFNLVYLTKSLIQLREDAPDQALESCNFTFLGQKLT